VQVRHSGEFPSIIGYEYGSNALGVTGDEDVHIANDCAIFL